MSEALDHALPRLTERQTEQVGRSRRGAVVIATLRTTLSSEKDTYWKYHTCGSTDPSGNFACEHAAV